MFVFGFYFQITLVELKFLMRSNFFIELNEQFFVCGIVIVAHRAFFKTTELYNRVYQRVEFVERADILPVYLCQVTGLR